MRLLFAVSFPFFRYLFAALPVWIVSVLLFLIAPAASAQDSRAAIDSMRKANAARIDSTRRANAARMDSIKTAREAATKLFKEKQKRRTDSLAALRKYRESKRYKDSVTRVRQHRTDSMRAIQRSRTDSATAERNRVRDSAIAARNATLKELRAVQKKRSDSLAAIRKYRESKRYADSVAVVRKVRSDSLQAARKAFADSARASRKAIAAEMAATRKKTADSLAAIRKRTTDSITAIRKQRSDSLAVIRAAREKAQKAKEKDKEKKFELALNLKIAKKREKWSNESMLKKRWGVPRKQIQNLFTHYNYYFNANRKMEEAEANMLRVKKDNFDKTIDLFPFNPDTDSTLLLADMDSIVQKTSVGIQIHDPRTDWADELYLLLGQAYYYKGNYDNAAIAFRYVISLRQLKMKEEARRKGYATSRSKSPSILQEEKKSALDFLKHESVHNDALLWLSRTYAQMGRFGEAESILDLLVNDPNFPETLRGRYSMEAANLALKTKKYSEAPGPLLVVAEDKKIPGWQRQRAAFLAGQLLQEEGKYTEAANAFAKVVDLNPRIEMDFQARKNRAYSVMASGTPSEETVTALRKMLKDSKYAPYYEQVYYVLGRVAANSGDRPLAINYLNQSLRAAKTTRSQKALSFLALGDVYYADGSYNPAQSAYDSAAFLAGKDASKAPFDVAVQRARSLTAVAGPARLVASQDSLLTLSNKPEKEQRAVVRKYLKALSAQKADSLERASGGDNNTMALPVNDGSQMGGGSSWYFASATTLQQGFADFRRKWGNRALTDNWRRASANAMNLAGAGQDGQPLNPAAQNDAAQSTPGPASALPTEASLLALIPSTEAERETLRRRLQQSMLALATAYTNDVQDYPRAMKVLDDMDRRFPQPQSPDEALYLGYLIYLRQNQIERAQMLAQQLLEKYPQSSFADRVRPSDDDAGPLMTSAVESSAYYEDTYNLVQRQSFNDALRRSRDGQQRWSDPRINERFRILEIMALSGNREFKTADSLVGKFISTTANDSLRSWAQALQDFIRQEKAKDTMRPTVGIINTVGNVSGNRPVVAPDSTLAAAPMPAAYAYKPGTPHVFAFAFDRMEPRVMGLKAGLGDMNTLRFGGDGLQTSLVNFPGGGGLVVVEGFSSAAKAKAYEKNFYATPVLTKEFGGAQKKTLLISEENLRKLSADGVLAPYEVFFRKNYR